MDEVCSCFIHSLAATLMRCHLPDLPLGLLSLRAVIILKPSRAYESLGTLVKWQMLVQQV